MRILLAVLLSLALPLAGLAQSFQTTLNLSFTPASTGTDGVVFSLIDFKAGENIVLATNEEQATHIQATVPVPGVYMIGIGNEPVFPILLTEAGQHAVVLDYMDSPAGISFPDLPRAQDYWGFWVQKQELNNNLSATYEAVYNTGDRDLISKTLDSLQNAYTSFFAEASTWEGLLGASARLTIFPSYDAAGEGYSDPTSYLLAAYYKGIDLNDPLIGTLPELFFYAQGYVGELSQVGLTTDEIVAAVTKAADAAPAGSRAKLSILAGAVSTAMEENEDVFFALVPVLAAQCPGTLADKFTKEASARASLRTGSPAPDFELATPDGKLLKLSDLRGQYVLIDFWASWCGPCRQENPNVVKLYETYHERGFEILGVSLDQEKENWLEAIAADKLTWKHVSDLAGWSSAAGAKYAVQAIPQTFLIDPKGIIIAKGLRGEALEAKLAEILP